MDGDDVVVTEAEFFEANECLAGTSEAACIGLLEVGDEYEGGGGAAPEWKLRRLA